MTNEEIRKECEQHYDTIRESEARLKLLRSYCLHEKTFRGTYSWRVGVYDECDICEYCGTPVNFINKYFPNQQSQNQPTP